jgi:hypothetical protein
MDNLCHRCNSEVAPGTPFCPQCGAPQIRVAPSVPQSPISQIEGDEDLPSSVGHPQSTIRWSSALPKTAVSGFATVALLILIAGLTRMPAFLFLVIPLGGAFSVLLYSRGNDRQKLTTGAGARLGAVTGFFTFVFYSLKPAAEFSLHREEILDLVRKALQEAVARSSDPQAQTVAQQLMTPTGLITIFICVVIILFVVFIALSSVGGAAGAAISQNSRGEED